MAIFPSQEWCNVLAETLNTNPDFAKNSTGYVGTSMWVVTPQGSFNQTVRIFTSFDHGHVCEAYVMADGDTREAENTATAPLDVWSRILKGKLHPMPAVMRGQLKLEGKSMKVIRNVRGIQTLFEHALHIPTEFPE